MLAWSSFFGAGRPFKIYVARLEKACLLLGVSTSWKTKAAMTAGYGLESWGPLVLSKTGDLKIPAVRAGDRAFLTGWIGAHCPHRLAFPPPNPVGMPAAAQTAGGRRPRF